MAKRIDIDKDGTVTARASGDNQNNFAALGINPGKQRLGISGGVGITGDVQPASGITLIGTGGVTASLAGNIGLSAEQGIRQHKARATDIPLKPGTMNIFEMRDVLNEVVALTGGDVRKLTVAQVHTMLNEHPNAVKPDLLAKFNKAVVTMQDSTYVPPPELPQAQRVIAEVYRGWQEAGSPQISLQDVDKLLDRFAPSVSLTGSTRGVVQNVLNYSNGNIDQAFQLSQNLPPELLTRQNAAEIVMPMTISELNAAAARAQAYIATNGGTTGAANALTSTLNDFLAATGQPLLTDNQVAGLQSGAAQGDQELTKLRQQYAKLPSASQVLSWQKNADKLVAIDPTAEISVFAGAGLLTPKANAAIIAQRSASVGVGNVAGIVGEGLSLKPAITKSLRGELGVGDPAASFSPDTAQKLNLNFSSGKTHMGAYAYAQKDSISWHDVSGKRTVTEAGVGATFLKPLTDGTAAFVNMEAGKAHVSGEPVSGLPSGTQVRVKGGITF